MTHQKLRIAFIAGGFGLGGAERQLGLLITNLDRSQFEPVCIGLGKSREAAETHLAMPDVDPFADNGPLSEDEQKWLFEEENCYSLYRKLRPVLPVEVITRSGGLSPHVFVNLYRYLRSYRPHVVQTWGWLSGFYGIGAALAARVPVIVGGERGSTPYTGVAGLRKRYTDRVFGRFASAVVANSTSGAELLRLGGLPHSKLHVIENGIDEFLPDEQVACSLRARFGLDPQTFTVGMLANLTPVKNHSMLLRAIHRLKDKLPVKAILVGEGPMRGAITRMAHDLNIEENIIMAGWFPEVRPIYGCLDVLALTSHSEGFSNALGEAMVAGVPIVATDVPGTQDVVRSGVSGFLVPDDDDEALADRLQSLADNRDLGRRVAARAQQWVLGRYSVSHMARRYEQLYQSLHASRRD